MCEVAVHSKRKVTAQMLDRFDPTHTTALRNAFAKDAKRRFKELEKVIWQAIVVDDCFGLNRGMTLHQMGTPGHAAFAFATSEAKVTEFMKWMNTQVNNGILTVKDLNQLGSPTNGAWTNKYVYDSYRRGVIRARYELQKAGFGVPSIEQTGGAEISMGTPFHMDRLGVLYSRVFSELKGITQAMDGQISRVLTQGIMDGDNPRLLARKLVSTINGVGMGDLAIRDTLGRFIPAERRAGMLARTEVIRAHHQATIQEYKNWGAAGVSVKAEWSAVGDSETCERCASMNGRVFTLAEIQGMIPAHTHCRCIALPTNKGLTDEATKTVRVVKPVKTPVVTKPVSDFVYNSSRTATQNMKGFKQFGISNPSFFKPFDSTATTTEAMKEAYVKGVGQALNEVNAKMPQVFLKMNKKGSRLMALELSYVDDYLVEIDPGVGGCHWGGYLRKIRMAGKQSIIRTTPSLSLGTRYNVAFDYPSIFRHELGHHVHDMYKAVEPGSAWTKFFKSKTKDWWSSKVSIYSGTNEAEAFAESFCAYTSPKYGTTEALKLPKEIENLLEKIIKTPKGFTK